MATLKKPKYKIGDIVVYMDRYTEENEMSIRHQSKIIEAYSYFDPKDKDDTEEWFYNTEEIRESKMDFLEEDEIMMKI